MNTLTEFQRLWFMPGELAILLEKYGVRLDANTPLAGEAVFRYQELLREPDQILAEVNSTVNRENLSATLHALARPGSIVKIKRGRRRRAVEISYACMGHSDDDIVLLKTRQDEGGELLFPFSIESLTEMLSSGMQNTKPLGIPMDEFLPLSPVGLGALLALADLFNEEYPTPDPDWLPESPLLFSLDSWYELLQDGRQAEPQDSLVAAFQDLTGVSIPDFDIEELASLLFVFTNEGYIGVETMENLPGDRDAVYYVSKDLTLALRCLAWWDLRLGIESFTEHSPHDALPFYALQATAIWQFSLEKDMQRIILHAIEGQELKNKVYNLLQSFLNETLPSARKAVTTDNEALIAGLPVPTPPSARRKRIEKPVKRRLPPHPASPMPEGILAEAETSSKKPPARRSGKTTPAVSASTCPACGKPINPKAKFCRSCGAAITHPKTASAKTQCPHCGKTVRQGAAFCRHCGHKLS
ncbi:MAG: zinc ribbon domain-containing protein [Anaerolineales bacterium]|nr:zinc ribbon domain-containing protein [Anaerolineales bacterium]